MISRRQAEAARDHAMHAHAGVTAHLNECGKCQRGGVPCKLGSILQRGAMKISREARDALTAYLPAGSQVTYHGRTAAYRDRVWVVVGPSPDPPMVRLRPDRARNGAVHGHSAESPTDESGGSAAGDAGPRVGRGQRMRRRTGQERHPA